MYEEVLKKQPLHNANAQTLHKDLHRNDACAYGMKQSAGNYFYLYKGGNTLIALHFATNK